MLAHTADRQQLGSSPGFTFQEVGVCVVPMNQEDTLAALRFLTYSSILLNIILGMGHKVQVTKIGFNSQHFLANILNQSKI